MNDILKTFIEVEPLDKAQFLKVRETLTRMGIASYRDHTLHQSCHVLQKRGKYYIVHYKEMRALDGLESGYDDDDRARRNTVADLLTQWFDFVKVKNPEVMTELLGLPLKDKIKVIHFDDKKNWELVPMYEIGKRK